MKRFVMLALFAPIGMGSALAQKDAEVNTADSTGLPGDHFSLEGALELFKKATSLEDFEKQLNSENNHVNNLDLNGDNEIDYVRVVDHKDADAHAIVLQVPVSSTESQDVAVIELEKAGKDSAILQIVGDPELYGDSAIVEPFAETEGVDKNDDGKGPAPAKLMYWRVVVNVWWWPCVKFVYGPTYTVWISPWYWHHYPVWWKPWKPHPWRWHHKHCHPYRHHYHHVHVHRVKKAHVHYGPHRKTSVVVKTKYKPNHVAYKASKKPSPYKPKQVQKSSQPNKTIKAPNNKKMQKQPVNKQPQQKPKSSPPPKQGKKGGGNKKGN
ncbi:MAG: hypothetical protein AB1458_13785 [Bacteroidota bacterium]